MLTGEREVLLHTQVEGCDRAEVTVVFAHSFAVRSEDTTLDEGCWPLEPD